MRNVCLLINNVCLLMSVYVCVLIQCVCVCMFFSKKRVFITHFNCMFIKLVSTHLGQGLMLCNISVINLSD